MPDYTQIQVEYTIRNASDYGDMFIASKTDTETQTENAEFLFDEDKDV